MEHLNVFYIYDVTLEYVPFSMFGIKRKVSYLDSFLNKEGLVTLLMCLNVDNTNILVLLI